MLEEHARQLVIGLGVGCALVLQGCATAPPALPEKVITQLANQRWQHKLDGDWDKAYAMLTPAYRALRTRADYQKQFSGAAAWKNAEVVSAACEPEACKLRVTLTLATPLARRPGDTLSTTFDETWLRQGGSWYYYEQP